MEKKKWYQSKIALLGVTLALVAGTQLGFNWLGTQVTPQQIDVVQQTYPEVAEAIKKAANSGNVFQAISGVAGALVAVWRIWFTKSVIV